MAALHGWPLRFSFANPVLSVCRYVGDDALFMAGAPIRNVVYVVGVREAGLQAALDAGTVTGPGESNASMSQQRVCCRR
jgi:hypothetical protein